MKTEGLNYLEAVKALADGKCEKIESRGCVSYSMDDRGVVSCGGGSNKGIRMTPKEFLDEWSLIGVKQKVVFTEVEWHADTSSIIGHIFPTVKEWPSLKDLVKKPQMKMTLEWIE